MSFQKIDRIKDALSYIWDLDHKIPVIMSKMHYPFLNQLPMQIKNFSKRK